MPGRVDLEGLRALLARGAQLVEVLPVAEYTDEHLPGAINLPLKELDATTGAARLDRSRPGSRLLLGRPVRHEPPSRVPA
jgi:rhodanese-related sulfurtransferase